MFLSYRRVFRDTVRHISRYELWKHSNGVAGALPRFGNGRESPEDARSDGSDKNWSKPVRNYAGQTRILQNGQAHLRGRYKNRSRIYPLETLKQFIKAES
jgi:hypothetical protein